MDKLDFFMVKTLGIHHVDRNAVEQVHSSFNYQNHNDVSQHEVLNHFHYLTSPGLIEMPDKEEIEKCASDMMKNL